MELIPEEIAQKIVSKLSYYYHNDDMHKPEVLEDASKLIREYGEQLLEAEQNKLISQVKSLTTDQLHEPAEAFRIAGKIEGLKMGIENIRQTLKSK